jgi:hypothetical protein
VEADVAQLELAGPRLIRTAATEARGIIDTMNVAITTDQRICTR